MRLPSVHGTRGRRACGCLLSLLIFALFAAFTTGPAQAQVRDIQRYVRETGNINFVTTGGSLRNSPNTGNACTVNSTSTQMLSGIPTGRTVRAAYLYWGASGTSPDTSVTFNNTTVTATRTFTRTFNNGTAFNFYGGFAVVTNLVNGNGSYTFGGLNVSTGSPWC
ncbi:MAG: conserved repeat domain, partial [Steroidobacteraceae bacterium]|nr:conserved repeat domain [Steroidobacteraceae bacterium]